MPSGPDHYREAERLLAEQTKIVRHHDDTCPEADRMIAEAQVHATLANAAAIALAAVDPGPLEWNAWRDAAGVSDPEHGGEAFAR